MSLATTWPMQQEEWTIPDDKPTATSLMTPLGVVSGEILTYLETHGAITLRRLARELPWGMPMVMMAVGALAREGLVRAMQHDLEVIVEPVTSSLPTRREISVPEVWGG